MVFFVDLVIFHWSEVVRCCLGEQGKRIEGHGLSSVHKMIN
jgi:hypothetical protein